MTKTLLLGYGNVDRQDDGVAWHVLADVAVHLDPGFSPCPDEDGFDLCGREPELLFVLQLTPELAEIVSGFDRVCFIDAHTGSIPTELQMIHLKAQFQASPFTHHLTPETCLSFCEHLYGRVPESILVSVRGYEFGFSSVLSPKTALLALEASKLIRSWLTQPDA